jgi:hypothetical protein
MLNPISKLTLSAMITKKNKYKIKYYSKDNITLKTIEIKKIKNINFINFKIFFKRKDND